MAFNGFPWNSCARNSPQEEEEEDGGRDAAFREPFAKRVRNREAAGFSDSCRSRAGKIGGERTANLDTYVRLRSCGSLR